MPLGRLCGLQLWQLGGSPSGLCPHPNPAFAYNDQLTQIAVLCLKAKEEINFSPRRKRFGIKIKGMFLSCNENAVILEHNLHKQTVSI